MTDPTPKPLALELAERCESLARHPDLYSATAAELRRQHQAIVELQADAERYRWLRGGKARTGGGPRAGRVEVFQWDNRMEGTQLKGEALDVAVDRARATLTKHQEP